MTALSNDLGKKDAKWASKEFTLSSGKIAYKNAQICIALGTGEVVPATATTGLLAIGVAAEKIDASSAAKSLTVRLDRELSILWMANDATTPVVSTDLGSICYLKDDATVSMDPAGRSPAGRIWGLDSTKGVAVERVETAVPLAETPSAGSYTSNDYAPTTLVNGATYDVPTTGAASTITLPAAALDGTVVYFSADGTKNGHTVQYKDATGPTSLTTALTASKRHLVVCAKRGGKWFANAYVSP